MHLGRVSWHGPPHCWHLLSQVSFAAIPHQFGIAVWWLVRGIAVLGGKRHWLHDQIFLWCWQCIGGPIMSSAWRWGREFSIGPDRGRNLGPWGFQVQCRVTMTMIYFHDFASQFQETSWLVTLGHRDWSYQWSRSVMLPRALQVSGPLRGFLANAPAQCLRDSDGRKSSDAGPRGGHRSASRVSWGFSFFPGTCQKLEGALGLMGRSPPKGRPRRELKYVTDIE